MCILVCYVRCIPGYPLVLCANRDEYYGRPAAPPGIQGAEEDCGCSFLAPLDLKAGGTWIGLNSRGCVAAVTNRRGVPFREGATSRGYLCAQALGQGDVSAMVARGEQIASDSELNGFNLFVADAANAWLLVGGGPDLQRIPLPPGVHTLTNEHELDRIVVPPPPAAWHDPPTFEDLARHLEFLLRRHEPVSADGFAPCKHFVNRGTRSSTLIVLGVESVHFRYADGAPCETSFVDLSKSVSKLLQI